MENGLAGRLVGELAEGEGEAHGFDHGVVVPGEVGGHAVHLVFEEVGFHDPGALHAPAGGGHLFDDELFGAGGGGELVDVGLVEVEEFGAGLDGEAEGVGEAVDGGGEAVAGGVGGGAGFAFGSDGAAGFGSVGAGGGDAAWG